MLRGVASDLRAGWTELLDRIEWDWVGTLTFRDEVHPEAAAKRFGKFVAMMNRSIYGPRWSKKPEGVIWAKATESQRRGVLHFHVLLAGVCGLNPLPFILHWKELAGFAKIERLRDQKAAIRYILKYVGRGCDLEVGGPWSGSAASRKRISGRQGYRSGKRTRPREKGRRLRRSIVATAGSSSR